MPRAKPTNRRQAALTDLMHKPRRVKTFELPVGDEVLTIQVSSINTKAYDDMVGRHPPDKAAKAEGASWDIDTFAPELLAACTVSPKLSLDEANEIWSSDDWARGELLDWFLACMDVNNQGITAFSNANGSGRTPASG